MEGLSVNDSKNRIKSQEVNVHLVMLEMGAIYGLFLTKDSNQLKTISNG